MPTISIEQIREQYPQYNDLSDENLAKALHGKYYSDMDYGEFSKRVGIKQEEPRNTGLGRTVLNQAAQGATFGLSDEIQAGLGALYAKVAGVDKSVSELYDEALESQRKDLAAQMKERPVTSVISNLGGALLTGGAAASTKAGKQALGWAGSGSKGARVAKGSATGAASGAAYGFGTGEGDLEQRIENAGTGAALGAAVATAVPAASSLLKSSFQGSKNIVSGMGARTAEQLDESANTIRQASNAAYKAMKEIGATFTPKASQKIIRSIESKIQNDGILNPKLHDKIIGLMDDFKVAAQKQDFSLEELDQWRQLFGEVAGNFTDKVNARKATMAIRALDDIVNGLGKKDLAASGKEALFALKVGRSEWTRASKFERVAEVIKKADGDPNRLKSSLKRFLDNPKKTRGFTKAEIEKLQRAARLTTTEGLMKAVGKFGFDIGQSTGNTALPVGSLVLGAPALTAAGTAARQGQKYLARNKAEELLKTIEGVGQQIPVSPPSTLMIEGAAVSPALSLDYLRNQTVPTGGAARKF